MYSLTNNAQTKKWQNNYIKMWLKTEIKTYNNKNFFDKMTRCPSSRSELWNIIVIVRLNQNIGRVDETRNLSFRPRIIFRRIRRRWRQWRRRRRRRLPPLRMGRLVQRSFVDIQITERQNVDINIVQKKCRHYLLINLPEVNLPYHNLT
jgi:hypothetical protein